MAESRGPYERRRPALPRTYTVSGGPRPRLYLGVPVVDALDAEPGDPISVAEGEKPGTVVLEKEGSR